VVRGLHNTYPGQVVSDYPTYDALASSLPLGDFPANKTNNTSHACSEQQEAGRLGCSYNSKCSSSCLPSPEASSKRRYR